MSTKYILDEARSPVGNVLRGALIPMVGTMMLLAHPELAEDPAELKSRAKVAIEPIVASLVEELNGNREGSGKVLVETTLREMKRHVTEMSANRGNEIVDAIDAIFRPIFEATHSGRAQRPAAGDALKDAEKAATTRPGQGNHEQRTRQILSDIFDNIDPSAFRGGRTN